MRDLRVKHRKLTAGFTRSELLVLLGMSTVLSVVLGADLSKTKSKLLQQACAANLKHWGVAIDLYSQDYNGTYYYDGPPSNAGYGDHDSPYLHYLGGSDATRDATMRAMRICPFTLGTTTNNLSAVTDNFNSYSMPVGIYSRGGPFHLYSNAGTGGPFFVNGYYWPNLKSCPNGPAKFLLLIDANGYTLQCGGLVSAVSSSGRSIEFLPAIDRHGGSVNCLFGDSHVELVSAQVLSNQDAIGLAGNSWFALN